MQDPLERPATAYMHREFVMLDENVNVAHAVGEMQAHHAETIIVTKSGVPVGIVTDSDILNKVVMRGEDSDNVYLKSIMTSPIITLSSRGSVEQALQLMRINQVKRIPITDDVSIIGMVTQRALADAVRNAVIESTFRSYRAAIRQHYKPILGNLGFILQFAGILMIAPTYLGTALGENVSATGIFLAAVHLLGAGFVLNAYGEKRPLNLKQASILVISSFLVLSLFGSIPYIYVNPFSEGIDPLSLFMNSFFESASGFTTTGLSMISRPENLTTTMVFYRSYTQWIGGLSFIYLIMTLFYPERKLSAMKSVLGGGMLRFKQMLVTVGVIFSAYTVGLVLFLVLVGHAPDVYAVSIIFSSVTGGGFVPASNILAQGQPQVLSALIVGMVISALPFAFHYSIFSKQARTKRLTSEVIAYGVIMGASIPLFTFLTGASWTTGSSWFSSIFHIVSASTNSGFQYIDARALALDAKILLIVLMFIGGTAFSTAGGIKVARVLILFQRLLKKGATTDTPSSISILSNPHKGSLIESQLRSRKWQQRQENGNRVAGDVDEKVPSTGDGEAVGPFPKRMSLFSDRLLRESAIVISSFVTLAVATGTVVAYMSDSSIENGIFEAASAITTTGMSTGITSLDLDLLSKLLLTANMIVGRFEIIAVLYIFFEALRR
ncbi:MAG TPA: potassium transporter TrkG [Nitrososphaera sp.]|nr:potassium transporter TrkG [Nitrososphaera sp.]